MQVFLKFHISYSPLKQFVLFCYERQLRPIAHVDQTEELKHISNAELLGLYMLYVLYIGQHLFPYLSIAIRMFNTVLLVVGCV